MLHGVGVRLRSNWSQLAFRWAFVLTLMGLIQRIILFLVYEPITYSDTNAYLRLAKPLTKLTLKGYDGTRVPGYPALLALAGLDEERAWILQLVIGFCISLILFWMAWKTTGNPALGALLGGLYNLVPGQFLFESNLLSETLTTLAVIVGLAIFVALMHKQTMRSKLPLALLLGLAAGMPGMVRPYFFPVTLWYLPFVWAVGGRNWRQRIATLVLYSVGPLLIQGGWLLWIRDTYHMVSPTVMAGYSLVQHTGEFFELLPDDVASIRDTYLTFRDIQIAERGVQTNAIWEAIPAMSEASGLGFYDLSRELRRLSLQLIQAHPDLYLRNVAEGWINFWKAPVYWQPAVFESAMVRSLLQSLVVIGRGLSVLINAAFLVLSVLAVLSRRVRKRLGVDVFMALCAGMVGMISVVQTIVDHGDNPRFLVPLQMVVFYVVFRAIWSWWITRSSPEVLRSLP
ncbi:MAG: hypothetical protein GTO14_11415 [Anaerolineales bacterium]|nr:hypothetical protein [Anaerolineales bacterium]